MIAAFETGTPLNVNTMKCMVRAIIAIYRKLQAIPDFFVQ